MYNYEYYKVVMKISDEKEMLKLLGCKKKVIRKLTISMEVLTNTLIFFVKRKIVEDGIRVTFAVTVFDDQKPEDMCEMFLEKFFENIECTATPVSCKNISVAKWKCMKKQSYASKYISKQIYKTEPADLWCYDSLPIHGNFLLNENEPKESLYERAERLCCGKDFCEELDRIYAGSGQDGHYEVPVHYQLCCSDPETMKEMQDILLKALYQNHRIQKKYGCLYYRDSLLTSEASLEDDYKEYEGSAVVISGFSFNCGAGDRNDKAAFAESVEGPDMDVPDIGYDGELSRKDADVNSDEPDDTWGDIFDNDGLENIIPRICQKYEYRVLTIHCIDREHPYKKNKMFPGRTVVLNENVMARSDVDFYLKQFALRENIEPDEELYRWSCESGERCSKEKVDMHFDKWLRKKICSGSYPQYKQYLVDAMQQEDS